MPIIEVYVGSAEDEKAFRNLLVQLRIDGSVRIVDDPGVRLPAIRTRDSLYEGELVVGRFLAQLASRSSPVAAAV